MVVRQGAIDASAMAQAKGAASLALVSHAPEVSHAFPDPFARHHGFVGLRDLRGPPADSKLRDDEELEHGRHAEGMRLRRVRVVLDHDELWPLLHAAELRVQAGHESLTTLPRRRLSATRLCQRAP